MVRHDCGDRSFGPPRFGPPADRRRRRRSYHARSLDRRAAETRPQRAGPARREQRYPALRKDRLLAADRDRRVAAIFRALPAHLGAQFAMLVVVALALRGAGVACPGAELERLAQDLIVRPGVPEAEVRSGIANVGTVEAGTDALAHVHVLGRAGIGAAQAHFRAIHRMVDGIAERLVDVAGNAWVKADHLADGHGRLLNFCGEPARGRAVPIVTKGISP